jgi:hypothetical protein
MERSVECHQDDPYLDDKAPCGRDREDSGVDGEYVEAKDPSAGASAAAEASSVADAFDVGAFAVDGAAVDAHAEDASLEGHDDDADTDLVVVGMLEVDVGALAAP